MMRIAAHEGTPLAQAMLDSYRGLTPEARTAKDLDSSEWPEPTGPRDRYLLAYHAIRSRDAGAVLPNLGEEVRAAVPHAEELHMAWTFGSLNRSAGGERLRLANEFVQRLARLELAYGARTASTQNLLGAVCGIAGWHEEGLRAAESSIELAPRSHTNRTNAAGNAVHLGLYSSAREHALVGLELAPWDLKCADHLMWACIGARDFDAGLEAFEPFAAELDAASPGLVASKRALIEIYRGLDLRASAGSDEPDGPDTAALQACLDRAEALTRTVVEQTEAAGGNVFDPTHYLNLIEATREGADARLFQALALEALSEPRPWLFARVLAYFPEQLPDPSGQYTRALLESLLQQMLASESVFAGK
jgi:hypothetical protein